MNEDKNIAYYDVLRNIAIVGVILIHVSAIYWRQTPISFEWLIANTYHSLARFSVPVFFMISGALLLSPERKFSIGRLYRKNIARLVVSYCFFGSIYVLVYNSTPERFDVKLISGHYHLWFIYVMIGLYIITPFLRKIMEDISLIKYLLLLTFLFSWCVQFISPLPVVGEDALRIVKRMQMDAFGGYVGYFVLGYYLTVRHCGAKETAVIYCLGILSLIFTISATGFGGIYLSKGIDHFNDYCIPPTFFISTAVFIWVKNIMKKRRIPIKILNASSYLSKLSFGIYLCHVLILDIIVKALQPFEIMSYPFAGIPVIVVLVYFFSALISGCLKRIPILNQYIV